MTLHPEVLPPAQREVLVRLGPAVDARGFHMAGGTALALQMGHRRSIDFDWFRPEPIDDPLALAAALDLSPTSSADDTLHAERDGVKLSFFTYRYPLLETTVRADDFGCSLASPRDIAAMKLAAITQRAARKDFFDVAALEEAGIDLGSMLAAYRERYRIRDIGHVLVALTWFDEADEDPEPIVGSTRTWEDVKAVIRDRVRAFVGDAS